MTREEAIEVIQQDIPCEFDADLLKAFEMAIQALEQEPILDKIKEIVDEWQSDTWTDNFSLECMVKIAELVESKESEGEE